MSVGHHFTADKIAEKAQVVLEREPENWNKIKRIQSLLVPDINKHPDLAVYKKEGQHLVSLQVPGTECTYELSFGEKMPNFTFLS